MGEWNKCGYYNSKALPQLGNLNQPLQNLHSNQENKQKCQLHLYPLKTNQTLQNNTVPSISTIKNQNILILNPKSKSPIHVHRFRKLQPQSHAL
jgi:hypothetical protein